MKLLSEFILISLLLVTVSIKAQSFVVKKSGEIVKCSKIIIREKVVILKDENSLKILKIEKDLLIGYYQDHDNAYYENKDGFKEEIVSGKIKIYRGEAFLQTHPGETISQNPNLNTEFGPMPVQYTKWYMEKDGLLFEAFVIMHGHGSSRVVNLAKEKIQDLLDEPLSKKIFNELKKKPKLESLLGIFQTYNAKEASKKKMTFKNNQSSNNLSKVIVFRDFGGEIKENLEFRLNDKKYYLKRNSKLEVLIPNNSESIICISNSINDACGVIMSSNSYTKYYQLKLNKKKQGIMTKVNGNSSYYRTRLDYYEKRAKK